MLVTLALLGATAANASSRRRSAPLRCPPRGVHVHKLKADAQAELYTAPESPEYLEFEGVYGCTYRSKRSYLLGNLPENVGGPGSGSGVSRESLAGAFVAYEESSGGGGPTGVSWIITVRNLENGRVKHSVPTGTLKHPEPPHEENGIVKHTVGIGPATAIVVTKTGAVAWIAEADVEGGYQVHIFDEAGNRVLATGVGVEPHSLTLAGRMLHWTEYGQLRSARIH